MNMPVLALIVLIARYNYHVYRQTQHPFPTSWHIKRLQNNQKSVNELFGSKGYDATSIAEIEKDLNQTRGAIAYHYKSKLGLFEATVNRYCLNRVMPVSVPGESYKKLSLWNRRTIGSFA